MNFLNSSVSESLYFAQVIVGATVAVVVIILSYRAYRQTKCFGFVLWIASSLLALCGILGWDVIGHAYPYPRIYPTAVLVYRSVYLLNSVVSVIGTVLVIRDFVRTAKAKKTR